MMHGQKKSSFRLCPFKCDAVCFGTSLQTLEEPLVSNIIYFHDWDSRFFWNLSANIPEYKMSQHEWE